MCSLFPRGSHFIIGMAVLECFGSFYALSADSFMLVARNSQSTRWSIIPRFTMRPHNVHGDGVSRRQSFYGTYKTGEEVLIFTKLT
jgi:hypothetical protein